MNPICKILPVTPGISLTGLYLKNTAAIPGGSLTSPEAWLRMCCMMMWQNMLMRVWMKVLPIIFISAPKVQQKHLPLLQSCCSIRKVSLISAKISPIIFRGKTKVIFRTRQIMISLTKTRSLYGSFCVIVQAFMT